MAGRLCLGCGQIIGGGTRCRRCLAVKGAEANRRGSSLHTPSWRAVRSAVLERDGYVCRFCGQPANTVDHVVPRHAGGTDSPNNLVAACGPCNSAKGTKSVAEFVA